tara:strand:+ start:151 stop:486 length:336 start_codon:yes stop_codon:yes gene_type:complete
MPNKHFCQGPDCHTRTTQDRFLKSRGVVRGRYASQTMDQNNYYIRGKYFCSTGCESQWLDVHMENIEQGRPIEFIRHRRESGGYEKVTTTHDNYYGTGTYKSSSIKRVDNV